MRKYLFSLIIFSNYFLNAQTPNVIGNYINFDDIYFSNQDKSSIYYYQSSLNSFTLKKVDYLGNFTTQFTKTIGSNIIIFEDIDMFSNKGIARLKLSNAGDTIFKFWLINGTTVQEKNLSYKRNGFDMPPLPILNSNFAYFFDEERIYKSDYSAAGTLEIFKSNLYQKLTSIPIRLLENNNILYWVDNGNLFSDPGFTDRRYYLYMYINGVTTKVDSMMNGEYNLLKDVVTGEVYASKMNNISSTTPTIDLYKFSNNGQFTIYNDIKLIPYEIVNGRILGEKINGQGLNYGVGVFNLNNLTTMSLKSNFSNLYYYLKGRNVVSNGTHCYFLGTNYSTNEVLPFFTDGDTLIKLSNLTYDPVTNWKEQGVFCGNDFWAPKYYTTGFPLAVDSFLEKFTPSNIITPIYCVNDTIDNFLNLESNNNHIFFTGLDYDHITTSSNFYSLTCGFPANVFNSNMNKEINIYPNPSKNNITISLLTTKNNVDLKIFNIYGTHIKSESIKSGINSILINDLAEGIYFIKIEGFPVYKFVKE